MPFHDPGQIELSILQFSAQPLHRTIGRLILDSLAAYGEPDRPTDSPIGRLSTTDSLKHNFYFFDRVRGRVSKDRFWRAKFGAQKPIALPVPMEERKTD